VAFTNISPSSSEDDTLSQPRKQQSVGTHAYLPRSFKRFKLLNIYFFCGLDRSCFCAKVGLPRC